MPETEGRRSEESNRKFFFADRPGKPIFERIRLCKELGSENPGKGSRIPERLRKNSGEFPEIPEKNRKCREIAENAGREFPEEKVRGGESALWQAEHGLCIELIHPNGIKQKPRP